MWHDVWMTVLQQISAGGRKRTAAREESGRSSSKHFTTRWHAPRAGVPSTPRGRAVVESALLLALTACAEPPPRAPAAPRAPDIELVESVPIETSLDHPDVRDAVVVWPELIDRARKSLEFEEFYASDVEGPTESSPLKPTLDAIDRAVKRGVKVRFLADSVMAPKYPATLDRLRAMGVEIRILEVKPRYGGVQHAKFIVVDDKESFVGSQNFDCRALSHIQEMGVLVRSKSIAGGLVDIFDTDWALADPQTPSTTRVHAHPTPEGLYASPADWLPDPCIGDLNQLVLLLDSAKTSVSLQVLTYSTTMRDKSSFTTLDNSLRRAAARGVKVRVLVSSWGVKPGSHELASVQALATVPNVEVKFLTVPPWSGGEVPFARVTHAKFLLVDRATAWIGTSNWEGDYFLKTRNVAIVTDSMNVVPKLAGIFEDDWASTYSQPLKVEPAAPPADSGPAPP
jgi:phosphatidylserine/phosphatidylglycerophosphate/cardiolipin synthase-like enzyme